MRRKLKILFVYVFLILFLLIAPVVYLGSNYRPPDQLGVALCDHSGCPIILAEGNSWSSVSFAIFVVGVYGLLRYNGIPAVWGFIW